MWSIEKIKKILPHRYPFLLVDKVLKAEAGKHAIALKNVTINEPFFQGHFPSLPVMPGVLIVEALAQVAGIAMYQEGQGGQLGFLAGLDKCKWKRQVVPGDQLQLEFTVTRVRLGIIKGVGIATVNGEVVCTAEITLAKAK